MSHSSEIHLGFRLSLKRLATAALIALSCFGATAVRAQVDPPGRIGQLGDFHGRAWLFDADRQDWLPAGRNRPLTSGDRLMVDQGGRAVVRIGSTTLRIAGGSDVELQRIDDEQIRMFLQRGTIAVQVTSAEVASEVEIATGLGIFVPMSPGHFRFDHRGNETNATTWSGSLIATGMTSLTVGESQQLSLRLIGGTGGTNRLASSITAIALDAFSNWVAQDAQPETRGYASQFVSPEMTGWEDLDRYGRWDSDPQYGALWLPSVVASDWAPYRFGQWIWVSPWGWTWVDNAPWGFAPFHYGRWVSVSGRWAWSPGQRVRRPTYSPALVSWTTRPYKHREGHHAGPAAAWKPLAPRERYVPVYRASSTHQQRIDLPHAISGVGQHPDSGRRGHGSIDERAGAPTGVRPGTTNRSREPAEDKGPAPGKFWNSGESAAPARTSPPPPLPTTGAGSSITHTPPGYQPPVSAPNETHQFTERPAWRGENGRRERSSNPEETLNVDRIRDAGRPPQPERAGQNVLEPVQQQRPLPNQTPSAAATVRPNPPVVVTPPPPPTPAPQQTRKPPSKGEKTDDGGNNNDTRRQNRTMER